MEFICFTDWKQLPNSADKLFSSTEKESVFYSHSWFEIISENVLASGQTLLFACVTENDQVLSLLPMKVVSPTRLHSLSNQFSSQFSVLLSDGAQSEDILTCLAWGLVQSDFNSFHFDVIDRTCSHMTRLQQLLELYGLQSHSHFRFYNWIHRLQGQNYHQYIANRPAIVRNSIQRKRRKLQREHNYEIRLFYASDLDTALTDYQTVYEASWKARETPIDFTPRLIRKLSRSNWARVAVMYIQNNPIAAQIWLIVHDHAYIYRLAHDQQWQPYSPGSILTDYLMQHTIDTEKVSEIDFLNGNERYKQDWMTKRKERYSLTIVKPQAPKKSMPILTFIKNFLNA